MTSSQEQRPMGLRERKKARTRDAIQRAALRLFTEQGYDATTVEQIAEAVEVSPSTYFRYFATKEEPVIYDRIDPILMASFLGQPAHMTPLQAVRVAIREVAEQLPAEESELEAMRHRLIFSVPDLRSRVMERLVDTMSVLADAVAQRVGCERDDERVQVFTGCVLGAMLAAVYGRDGTDVTEPPPMLTADMMARVDNTLEMLENGVPFERGNS